MLQKLLIKVGILIFALVIVMGAMNFFSSLEFKKSVGNFFGIETKTYHWCMKDVVLMTWLDEWVAPKWKGARQPQIIDSFCTVTMEPIRNLNLHDAHFKPLLRAQSAKDQMAILEWDPQLNLFKAEGLPFYSPSLGREILDR